MSVPAGRRRRALFGAGVLLGLLAEQVVLFAVPLLIYQNSENVSTLGLAFALEWLPSLIAYPFAGLIADRDGGGRLFSRAMSIRGLVLLCVMSLCLTEASWTTPALMTGGAIMSVFVAPTRMSVEKMVPQVADGELLPRTQALVQNMELLAMALGPALAMLATSLLGKVWLLGLAAVAFGVGAACWLPMPRGPRIQVSGTARQRLAELGIGWLLLVRIRPVLWLGILNFAINLAFATLLSVNAAVVTGVFHASDYDYGLLNTMVGLVGLVNLMVMPAILRRFGVGALGVTGFLVLCCALLMAGFSLNYPTYAAFFVLTYIGDALYNVFNRTQRIKVIPREHLGKVMGPFYLLNLLSMPVAGLLVGGFGTRIGPQHLVIGLTALLCLFGSLLLPLTVFSFHRALREKEALPVGASL